MSDLQHRPRAIDADDRAAGCRKHERGIAHAAGQVEHTIETSTASCQPI